MAVSMHRRNSKMKNRSHCSLITLGILLSGAAPGHATVIGFGQIGGNNANIENLSATGTASTNARNYGSNATANGNGFVVSNGATPNIRLNWNVSDDPAVAGTSDSEWDIHTSTFFNTIESQTVGGGAWDNEGSIARVAQLDYGNQATVVGQSITFFADAGFAFILNSFDFGHTAETAGTTAWTISLRDTGNSLVWSQNVSFTNGQAFTIAPNFTGTDGEDYTLTFLRTAQSYNSAGRHGLDNLSFSQVAVPEPAAGLLGLAGLTLLSRRRHRS